jgi:hypothetical protein
MNTQDNFIQRLHAAVPRLRQWIDDLLGHHADQARTVQSLGFEKLALCFPNELLERTKVVEVDPLPFPPVDRFGLPEFASMQEAPRDGITFKDTFFVQQGESSEILHFHELVHVVQWARLGVDNFLLAYCFGLKQFEYNQFEYKRSPLEQMAYTLQSSFESGDLSQHIVRDIEERTDTIWAEVAQIVQGGSCR